MAIDRTVARLLFSRIGKRGSTPSAPGGLRDVLHTKYLPALARTATVSCHIDHASMFATASVECWQRAIHSLIVSVSLTNQSQIWASVAGYYSSHYVMRAVSHLAGLICTKSPAVCLELEYSKGAGFTLTRARGESKEHSFYWLQAQKLFPNQQPLFVANKSDVEHRNRINYWDHINQLVPFRFPVDESFVRTSLQRLAELAPIEVPSFERKAAISQVQVVALHRLHFFRNHLDSVLTKGDSYWNAHREPTWCARLLKYPDSRTELSSSKDKGMIVSESGVSPNLADLVS